MPGPRANTLAVWLCPSLPRAVLVKQITDPGSAPPTSPLFPGLLPQALDEYPELGSFFDVLATTRDRQGKEYVSIFDGKRYPFSGLAFHPEKVPYEWTTTVHLPHTRMAVDAAYFLAQAFVDRARLSSHRGQNVVEEGEIASASFSTLAATCVCKVCGAACPCRQAPHLQLEPTLQWQTQVAGRRGVL